MSDASTDKVQIMFPDLNSPETNTLLQQNVLALSAAMCVAINEYFSKCTEDDAPSAYELGAACYVASYLLGLNFPDERRAQVTQGLMDILVLNADRSVTTLPIPPANETKH